MAGKSEKGIKKNNTQKEVEVTKSSSKTKKRVEKDDIDFNEDEETPEAGKKTKDFEDDEDDDEILLKKGDEIEDDWDPDFDGFDLPKSSKKVVLGKKEAKDNEDEFKVDEEFEDFFNSPSKKKYNDDDDDF